MEYELREYFTQKKRTDISFSCSHEIHMGLVARKPVFGGLRTTQAQTSLRIRYWWNFIHLDCLCSWGDWFESRYVGNHEDRSSRDEAHIIKHFYPIALGVAKTHIHECFKVKGQNIKRISKTHEIKKHQEKTKKNIRKLIIKISWHFYPTCKTVLTQCRLALGRTSSIQPENHKTE